MVQDRGSEMREIMLKCFNTPKKFKKHKILILNLMQNLSNDWYWIKPLEIIKMVIWKQEMIVLFYLLLL